MPDEQFNPLWYFCVYGDAGNYECLRIALTSLAEYGNFGGTVGVACDLSEAELIQYIPQSFAAG